MVWAGSSTGECKVIYLNQQSKEPKLKNFSLENQETDGLGFKTLLKHIFDNYKISGVFVSINGQFCCRISCYVYSCIEDYIALRDAIIDLM